MSNEDDPAPEPSAAAEPEEAPLPAVHNPQELGRRLKRSVQGVQYDLHHWSQLPPVRQGQPTLRCVQYVVGRNQRGPYLAILLAGVLLLLCVSVAVRRGRRCGAPSGKTGSGRLPGR